MRKDRRSVTLTDVPGKLLKIIEDIDTGGNAQLTRLTVMKKWFERPGRLPAFAIWVAKRAIAQKGNARGAAAALFKQVCALLAGVDKNHPELDRNEARALHDRLRKFQNEYRNVPWAAVRIIHNWNLFLVERGLAIYLGLADPSSAGYKLAADYCQHYDSHFGNGLNGPSRAKVMEIVHFIVTVEGLEDEGDGNEAP